MYVEDMLGIHTSRHRMMINMSIHIHIHHVYSSTRSIRSKRAY